MEPKAKSDDGAPSDQDGSDRARTSKKTSLNKVSKALEQLELWVRHPRLASQGYGTFQGIHMPHIFSNDRLTSGRRKVK